MGRFGPLRDSVAWQFNRLCWERLIEWETAFGQGAEAPRLSDELEASHEQAIDDSVGDFWTLLRDLEASGQLPADIFALELGIGLGRRVRNWLDRFKVLDEQCGTRYYSRLQFILGDCAPQTLHNDQLAVGQHAPIITVMSMDALNPFRALPFLRFKILRIHLSNVYGSLPFDELFRCDGQLHMVETRPVIGGIIAADLAAILGIRVDQIPNLLRRLVKVGPDAFEDRGRGMTFWRCMWSALQLQEQLRAIDDDGEAHLPSGLGREHVDELLDAVPDEIRCQLSWGAVESFANTLPLLHPRGGLQVQDMFVPTMADYGHGFHGPIKSEGSIIAGVNGPLLRSVGARAGYDVYFAPFRDCPDSKVTTLYATRRDGRV